MKYEFFFIVIILCFSRVLVSAQETKLYNSSGKLKIDTTYQINMSDLKQERYFEEYALQKVYESIDYPRIAYQNGIGGLVIARIVVMKGKLDTYCEIVKSPDPMLSNAVRKAFFENALDLLRTSETYDNIEFFVPFEFDVKTDSFNKKLESNKLIKIQKIYLEPTKKLL
jgi:antitoxin component YwqK of YwqJK toxin-antitoxin module